MEKPRDNKIYYRKVSFVDSQTNVLYNRKEREHPPRPRSRSVYTSKSHNSDNSGSLRDSKSYEAVVPWLSKSISNKTIFHDDFNHDVYHEDLSPIGVSALGVITLRLHDRVRVDISLDKAVRIINPRSGIVIALSASGSSAALMHPNGRVYQYGSRVEILAHDTHGNNKYAKMWYKGVSFTSDQCALVYLVDSAGTRTTTDTFSDLNVDFSISVFCSESPYNENTVGQTLINEAVNLLQNSTFWMSEDGTSNWLINNVRVSQTTDGLVRIGRNSNKFSLHTSPSNGSARISSPFLHCTGSMGQTRHLFVRRGERRMHYDGASFIVRNAGHSAGFDEKHQLKYVTFLPSTNLHKMTIYHTAAVLKRCLFAMGNGADDLGGVRYIGWGRNKCDPSPPQSKCPDTTCNKPKERKGLFSWLFNTSKPETTKPDPKDNPEVRYCCRKYLSRFHEIHADPDFSEFGGKAYKTCGIAYIIQRDRLQPRIIIESKENRILKKMETHPELKSKILKEDPVKETENMYGRLLEMTDKGLHPMYKKISATPPLETKRCKSIRPYRAVTGPIDNRDVPKHVIINWDALEKKNISWPLKRVHEPSQLEGRLIETKIATCPKGHMKFISECDEEPETVPRDTVFDSLKQKSVNFYQGVCKTKFCKKNQRREKEKEVDCNEKIKTIKE